MSAAPDQACQNAATHRRFWPGREPDLVCSDHQADTRAILRALGLVAVFQPVNGGECACSAGRVQRVGIVSSGASS